ncbi:hypothetical protein NM688_g6503 [Phlebia brevispora]|uniref:Uncharacterized protein n=1 Tax=Phlebia brevispora TaxID=194682 RepID=A0ACC1SFB3_9APHY|nr:hypothetical protein NM688_g6503 [Phlebia brevispora]
MDLITTRFLLSVQASVIVVCSLEESLELSSLRQSQILCNFLRLIIEIAASILRIPIRLLVCLRVCKASALEDFNTLARHVSAVLDLRTKDESSLLVQASLDEDDLIKHDEHMLRMQKRLARALDDVSRLRRDNVALSSRLNDIQAERATILCAVQELARPAKHTVDAECQCPSPECTPPVERPLGPNESHEALSSVRGRFDRLEQEFRAQQARCSNLEHELRQLKDDYQRLNEDLVRSQTAHQGTKDQLQALIQSCRIYQRTMQHAEAHRLKIIRSLTVALVIVLGFTRHLAVRLGRSMRGQFRVLSRWRIVSSQKVAARRELIKVMNMNQDLRRRLQIQINRRQHYEKWHAEFHKSVKARESAAKKFKVYHQYVTARYSSTVTRLLVGLLILWRLSLLLTQQLAEARVLARALEESAVAHEHFVAQKERSELRIRVMRLEQKIIAMESVDAAYLRILFEQTKPCDSKADRHEQLLLVSTQ